MTRLKSGKGFALQQWHRRLGNLIQDLASHPDVNLQLSPSASRALTETTASRKGAASPASERFTEPAVVEDIVSQIRGRGRS